MSKMQTVKGVLRMLWQLAKEDFMLMDHKLIRIGIGVITFLVMALVWFYLFRAISPFRF